MRTQLRGCTGIWRRVAVLALSAAVVPMGTIAETSTVVATPADAVAAAPSAARPVEDALCVKRADGQAAQVTRVLDGDTFKLADGRKVRLLGVNTPELAHRAGEVDEPYAKQAKDELSQLLKTHQNRVELVLDVLPQDHYQRTLAYAFLPTGENLGAALLRRGAGAAIVIPPNAAYADCFHKAETVAQKSKKGIWSAMSFGPKPAAEVVSDDERHFRLVRGKVTQVQRSGKTTLLTLDDKLQLKIADVDAGAAKPNFERWQGRSVEARGWISNYRGTTRMVLHHHSAMRLIQNSAPKKAVAPSK